MVKLKFKQTANTGGDCTAPYNVEISRECTVKELVETILTQKEWGYIDIGENTLSSSFTRVGYKGSTLIGNISRYLSGKRVGNVTASGGWGNMDYRIKLHENQESEFSEAYKLEDWQIEKIIDTLQVARNSLLGITALDSEEEYKRKSIENETCVVRMINDCLKWL